MSGVAAAMDLCKAAASRCSWVDEGSVCYPKGDRFPCRSLFDETLCDARDDCFYQGFSCDNCDDPSGCTPSTTTPKPIDMTACDKLEMETCSESPICAMNGDGDCVERTCADTFNQQACEYLNCSYRGDKCVAPDDGKPCSSYPDYESCGIAPTRCAYSFGDEGQAGGGGDPVLAGCRDAKCNDLRAEEDCTANTDCRWGAFGNFCAGKTDKDPCNLLYSVDVCGKSADCSWEESATVCYPTGSEVPCERYVSAAHMQHARVCTHIHVCACECTCIGARAWYMYAYAVCLWCTCVCACVH